jgi:hypothetical protein
MEVVGARAAEKGKAKATTRPSKRVKEEVGEEKPRLAKREVAVAHPDYMTVTPELWQKNKQKEGTYRYDYESWKGVQPPRNPWLVRGSRGGAFSAKGLLWVRIPSVVEVCRRVLGTETRKSEAYEINVPLPGDNVLRLNSMKGLWDLCYAVGTRGMFLDEGDVGGNLIKMWHKQPKTQVKDTEEALVMLDKWAQEHPSDAVDEYGPAVASPTTTSAAAGSIQTVARTAGTGQERTVRVTRAAYFVKEPSSSGSEPRRDLSESVSIPASSDAVQAASHPNVKHITDTLVRMGYLDDFQNGVFLLRDPLGDEIMGRRNKIAKRIESKADAEEAMLVLCREGKVDKISRGLFWILHFEGEKKPSGRTKSSSGSGDSQPPKKKPKTSQDKRR